MIIIKNRQIVLLQIIDKQFSLAGSIEAFVKQIKEMADEMVMISNIEDLVQQ